MTQIDNEYLKISCKLMIPHQSIKLENFDYDLRHFVTNVIHKEGICDNPNFLLQIHFELYLYNNTKSFKHLNN